MERGRERGMRQGVSDGQHGPLKDLWVLPRSWHEVRGGICGRQRASQEAMKEPGSPPLCLQSPRLGPG